MQMANLKAFLSAKKKEKRQRKDTVQMSEFLWNFLKNKREVE